jgi:hypothetical protein
VGLRVETGGGWTFISQWLSGETIIEPESGYEKWQYSSTFALVSKAIGQHRFSLRADWFDTDHFQTSFPPGDTESGSAWTLGYSYERDDHWNFAVEALQIKSDVSYR